MGGWYGLSSQRRWYSGGGDPSGWASVYDAFEGDIRCHGVYDESEASVSDKEWPASKLRTAQVLRVAQKWTSGRESLLRARAAPLKPAAAWLCRQWHDLPAGQPGKWHHKKILGLSFQICHVPNTFSYVRIQIR